MSRKSLQKIVILYFIFPILACTPSEIMTLDVAEKPQVTVVAENLVAPVGLAVLPNSTIVVAEEGTGERDHSGGVSLIMPNGEVGRLVSGFFSSRDAGDLAGVNLVAVSPDLDLLYIGHFNDEHLLTLPLEPDSLRVPPTPYSPDQLEQAVTRLNNVFLINPFDITFDAQGIPVITDASANGIATENPNGTARFIHRFERLPNLQTDTEADSIDAVPTGITRVGDRYYVTLTGGCPYPEEGGQLVAVDENRHQEIIASNLNMPIDVAQGPDGSIWVLEFARFTPGATCFDGQGYQPNTGRLSRLLPDNRLQPVLTNLNFPASVAPAQDGSLYISEVFSGRVLHVTFTQDQRALQRQDIDLDNASPPAQPSLAQVVTPQSSIKRGGDNDTQPLMFQNIAAETGLSFHHGAFRTAISPDPVAMMGGGLCWLDYDNDGWLDLYLVNSHAQAEVDYWQTQGGMPANELYRNQDGYFTAVGVETGTQIVLRGNGCVAADFNMDGWMDIYITADGPNALLWNQGDGTFVEGAMQAGVAAPEWNSAAVIGDLNGDGWPDMFVAAYIDLDNMIPKPSGAFPQDFYGLPDRLYLNNGIGHNTVHSTFREITLDAGLLREERGLGALFSDLDNDGDLDLYVANDGHPNRIYANEPRDSDIGFHFIDLTETAEAGDSGSGMGVAGGDYDGDGWTDLMITNWQTELNALYRNDTAQAGDLNFQYSTFRIGISGLGNNMTGWGTRWADFDHDTDQDLLVVNGRVPITDLEADSQLVRYYRNRSQDYDATKIRTGQFIEWTGQVGLKETGPLMARGSAVADFDNDGDLDIAINNIGQPATLLENRGAQGNWLAVQIDGFYPGTKAVVTLDDGRRLTREVYAGSSYLASEDPRIYFGLGLADNVTELEITIPGFSPFSTFDVAPNQVLYISTK
ncbi:MAG: ScyD/ScyE family protein [Chloroflexota bacterium]